MPAVLSLHVSSQAPAPLPFSGAAPAVALRLPPASRWQELRLSAGASDGVPRSSAGGLVRPMRQGWSRHAQPMIHGWSLSGKYVSSSLNIRSAHQPIMCCL
jgi:hypothetical protein